MNDAVRVTLVMVGSVIAGFALGFLAESVSGGSDSGAPPAGALLGFGVGLVVVAVTSRRGHTRS